MHVHLYKYRPFTQQGVKMVNYCVAAGCSNVPSDTVSLFKFPKSPALKAQWEKQVKGREPTGKHFTPESFEVDSQLAVSV